MKEQNDSLNKIINKLDNEYMLTNSSIASVKQMQLNQNKD